MPFRATRLTAAALMTALTAASAWIILPIGPVPVTMQSGVVLAAGALLGRRWGALSQVAYLVMGLVGVPVFAGGRAGPGVILSPTFGYLVGFVAAAFVTGWWGEGRPRATFPSLVAAMVVGSVALDACGVAYLYIYLHLILGQPATWGTVFHLGLLPFLPFDAVKIALAAAVVAALNRRSIEAPA